MHKMAGSIRYGLEFQANSLTEFIFWTDISFIMLQNNYALIIDTYTSCCVSVVTLKKFFPFKNSANRSWKYIALGNKVWAFLMRMSELKILSELLSSVIKEI